MTNSTQQLQRINMHPTVEGHDMLVLLTDLIRPQTITLTGPQDEDLHKEANDRIEGLERHHSNISKDLGEMVWKWAKEQMTGYGLPTSLTVLETEAPIGPK